jgi:ParB family chromosome partitioning protein
VKAYQQEAHRQKMLIKKAELTQGRLIFVVEAFRTLLRDDHFQALLKAENLESLPAYLAHQLHERAAL